MYRILDESTILNLETRMYIPVDNRNRHYKEYLEWISQGNEAEEDSNITEIDQIKKTVRSAISFGNKIIVEFAAENIQLGITQLGMTKSVRQTMAGVASALQTGSLYDAIDEVREIPDSKKDGKFISNKRLLKYVNKIEEFLGIEKSTYI